MQPVSTKREEVMGENSKIEWTDHTFNPWTGCTKVSAACDHCYAEGWAKRTGKPELWEGERRRTTAENWQKPLKWDWAAAAAGERHRVFCASLADVFDNQVPVPWRRDLWHRIEQTPNLDWLILTKRPQNIAKMLPDGWGDGWPNVWLGTTIEDAEEWRRRWPYMETIRARVRFVSYEPALGPIAGHLKGEFILPDWIIAGGESGPGARPAHPQWFRDVRDDCQRLGIAFFLKQWGEYVVAPTDRYRDKEHVFLTKDWDMVRVGKKHAGRLLDGVEHNGFPCA
jgi:protein gp37